MKKFFALILVFCMVLVAVACDGGNIETPSDTDTAAPSEEVTQQPTQAPTQEPTVGPTEEPTVDPTEEPTVDPTEEPTAEPTAEPTTVPTTVPTSVSTALPTEEPTQSPTEEPTEEPTTQSTTAPTGEPTTEPTEEPSSAPTEEPTTQSTTAPTDKNTEVPTEEPSESVTQAPVENFAPVDSARVDVDYYFAVEQGELGRTFYLDGSTDGFYPAADAALENAVRIRLEETAGGYYAYFIRNAVKYYINVEFVAILGRITFEMQAKTVFAFDSELKTLTTVIGEKTYYLGMYGEQRYFSISEVKYAAESFVANLYEAACDHQFIGDLDGHSAVACAKCGAEAGEKMPHGDSYSVNQLGKRTTYCSDCGYIVKVELCDGNHWLSDADGHWERACDICDTPADAKYEHGSIMAEYCTETSYSIGCATCRYAYYTKEIPESLTHLIGAMTWAKGATTYYQVNGGNGKSGTLTVDGVAFPYGSIVGNMTDPATRKDGQVLFNRSYSDTTGASDAQQYRIDVGEAKYLVFKIRTNDNTQHMSLSFSTTGKNGLGSFTMPLSSLANGEWGVIVIDLAATFPNHYVEDAETGNYLVDSFFFTMNSFEAATSIDVAYIAFVEGDWNDLDVLIDESEALFASGASSVFIDVETGMCKGEHVLGFTASSDNGGNTVYAMSCALCRQNVYERTVTDSVSKYYTGADFATGAAQYYLGTGGSLNFDSQNNVAYGNEVGNRQIIWYRAQCDLASNTHSVQLDTQDVGNARFLVIRLKTDNPDRNLRLQYSTQGKNSPVAIATEAMPDAYGLDGEKGVDVGEKYATASGSVMIDFPVASATKGQWTTYVIDLSAVVGDYHVIAEGASSYVVDTFYFDISQNYADGGYCVEYMAFVEGDWNDVCALVGEGDVINITATNGTCETKTLVAAE